MRPLAVQILIILSLPLLPAALAAWLHPGRSTIHQAAENSQEISLAQVLSIGQVLWIDARPRAKFDAGHIPSALLLNETEWEQLLGPVLEAWSPEVTVVVYCDSGQCQLSHHVARRLEREAGFEGVRILKGGWEAWKQAGR